MTPTGASVGGGARGSGGDSSAPKSTSAGQVETKVKVIGNYVLTGKTLGRGNFARVEEAQHTATKAKVAVKIINTDKIKEEYVRKNLLREAYIMRRLSHPNIVHLYETMKTRSLYCLVTECADGGELLLHVKNDHGSEKRLPESSARPFIRQLMSALQYMHEKGIVHRDLKMENILLDKTKKHIKIVDFGLSNSREPGEFLSTHCGSPEYAAPELFVPGKVYGQEVDVWSLGVNMFAMLAGRLPFRVPRQGPNRRQRLLEQISTGIGTQQEQESSHISSGAMDLARQLLQPDPVERPSIVQAMKHPWITKNGLYPLYPYREEGPDAEQHDRILDLMCARLDVTRRQVTQSVRESRCDWVAAIYHLLHDQPEGQVTLRDRTRQQLGQLLKTGNPAAGGSAAAAAMASDAAARQLQAQHHTAAVAATAVVAAGSSGGGRAIHLPQASPGTGSATVNGGNVNSVDGAGTTTTTTTAGDQVTTVNAAVKKFEEARRHQLKTCVSMRRHESTSQAARPMVRREAQVSRRHTFSTQRSQEDHIDGGDGGVIGTETSRANHLPAAPVTMTPSPSANHIPRGAAFGTQGTEAGPAPQTLSPLPGGPPIRGALTARESLSTSHASVSTHQPGHVVSMAQRVVKHCSTPVFSESGNARRHRESPAKSHNIPVNGRAQVSTTYDGRNLEEQQPVAVPRKRYNFLRPRKASKEKTSPNKYEQSPAEGIPELRELSEASNKISADQPALSLSRSFALKPHALASSNENPNSLLVLSRSAQFSNMATAGSGSSKDLPKDARRGGFGQQAPSYGQRQSTMGAAWGAQPPFTSTYSRQSPPSVRRTSSSKGRPRSVASPGKPSFVQAFSTTAEVDGRLAQPGFRYSEHDMAMENLTRGPEEDFMGSTLPTRSRRHGALRGIFGKGLQSKKPAK